MCNICIYIYGMYYIHILWVYDVVFGIAAVVRRHKRPKRESARAAAGITDGDHHADEIGKLVNPPGLIAKE